MSLMPAAALMDPSLSDLWKQLDQIEQRIREEFVHRIHNFRIRVFDDGLVLEGRTKTYYGKQKVQHAVMEATDLPILDNKIVVG